MTKPLNLTLIGMSGAGKSYIGSKVAQRLGLQLLDLDLEIEKDLGKILPEIVAEKGDAEFIKIESATTVSRTSAKSGLLISTGGSIIYAPEAMEHLKNISKIIYLSVPFSVIAERIEGNDDRMGRIVGLGSRTLKQLYDERAPLYERYADVSVELTALDLEEAVRTVAACMQE